MSGSRPHRPWPLAHLILLGAIAMQVARIASTSSSTGDTPFHSANDRSRWCTIASLVEDGQFEIDRLLEIRDRKGGRPWYTIDLVQHRGRDGRQHFYSSKPPLLAILYASVYAVLYRLNGVSLSDYPLYVGRVLLVICNLIPLYAYWWWWARYLRGHVVSSWSRMVLLSFIVWGTFLTTFASTLNNHLPAAISVLVSLAAWFRIQRAPTADVRWYFLAGLSAAFGATCDLPALSWCAALFGLLVLIDMRKAFVGYLAGAIPVGLAFAATTYWAHQDLRPPYAHRGIGPEIVRVPKATSASDGAPNSDRTSTTDRLPNSDRSATSAGLPLENPSSGVAVSSDMPELKPLVAALAATGVELSDSAALRPARWERTWELWDAEQQRRYAITDGQTDWKICHWDDWYDYPGSYWRPENKRGVDRGEASIPIYAFHVLFGHHGVLSLTPMWLLALVGAASGLFARDRNKQLLVVAIILVTLVCICYYCFRPLMDRNYGGVASGFRWLFWLAPLWTFLVIDGLAIVRRVGCVHDPGVHDRRAVPPTADKSQVQPSADDSMMTRPVDRSMMQRSLYQSSVRFLVYVALMVSIFSATYAWSNPWVHPWLYTLANYFGWV